MDRSKIRFYIKEYFTFSATEKVGTIVLITLILVIVGMNYLLMHFIPANPKIKINKFEKEIAVFERSDSIKTSSANIYSNKINSRYKQKIGSSFKRKITVIDINNADSASLEQLPGIGPVFAKRILKYRNILGGYFSSDQLNEVYGIHPEIILQIRKFIIVDTSKIRKININTDKFKDINSHPYISFEQTKSIMKYRFHDKFGSIDQLEGLLIFSHAELMKLRPYLLFK